MVLKYTDPDGKEITIHPWTSYRAADPAAFVSSVRIETRGGHDHVTVWVRGQCAGTLVVDAGQGVQLIEPLGPWQGGVMQG